MADAPPKPKTGFLRTFAMNGACLCCTMVTLGCSSQPDSPRDAQTSPPFDWAARAATLRPPQGRDLSDRVPRFQLKWASATSELERRNVCIELATDGLLVAGRDVAAIQRVYGPEFDILQIKEDGSGTAIVYCLPPALRDRGGWPIGTWHLHLSFGPWADGPGSARLVEHFYVTNCTGMETPRDY